MSRNVKDKDNSCPVQNPLQPVPAKGRGTIPSSIQVLHVLSMKQEITSKEFSSLRTVKGTAEGFTKPILLEYVVIFCIVRPNPNSLKNLFSSEECRSGARTSNPQFFCAAYIISVCSFDRSMRMWCTFSLPPPTCPL